MMHSGILVVAFVAPTRALPVPIAASDGVSGGQVEPESVLLH